jgi:hypothetical protein
MPQVSQQQGTVHSGQPRPNVTTATPSITTYLLIKPLHPPLQILPLLSRQILTGIQWPIQILRQHLLIKALTCQTPCRIPPCKVLIHATGPVEIPSRGHIVDFALHRQVHRPVILTIVRKQRARRERAEDGRGGAFWELDGRGGAEAEVKNCAEEDEECDVERGEKGVEDFLRHLLVLADVCGKKGQLMLVLNGWGMW